MCGLRRVVTHKLDDNRQMIRYMCACDQNNHILTTCVHDGNRDAVESIVATLFAFHVSAAREHEVLAAEA